MKNLDFSRISFVSGKIREFSNFIGTREIFSKILSLIILSLYCKQSTSSVKIIFAPFAIYKIYIYLSIYIYSISQQNIEHAMHIFFCNFQ